MSPETARPFVQIVPRAPSHRPRQPSVPAMTSAIQLSHIGAAQPAMTNSQPAHKRPRWSNAPMMKITPEIVQYVFSSISVARLKRPHNANAHEEMPVPPYLCL